eukprot:6214215-Pleurochrysis_carterae.AAC.1
MNPLSRPLSPLPPPVPLNPPPRIRLLGPTGAFEIDRRDSSVPRAGDCSRRGARHRRAGAQHSPASRRISSHA